MKQFAPPDAVIPTALKTERFHLRPLTIHDVVKDFDAVISSIEHLQGVFGPHDAWPTPDLTLTQDLIDLGWHHREFQCRRSFAFTVMAPDESRCLGCVYIEPSAKAGHDAQVFLWVRKSELAGGLDAALYAMVKRWLAAEWWFSAPAFPGRGIDWADWLARGRLSRVRPRAGGGALKQR